MDFNPSFRDGPKDQTPDVQLHIGESRDSGFDTELVIAPAEAGPVGIGLSDKRYALARGMTWVTFVV
jgi:hypothetical protein